MFAQTEVGEGDAPVLFVEHHVPQLQVAVHDVPLKRKEGWVVRGRPHGGKLLNVPSTYKRDSMISKH